MFGGEFCENSILSTRAERRRNQHSHGTIRKCIQIVVSLSCVVMTQAWPWKKSVPDAISRPPRIPGVDPDAIGNVVCPDNPKYPPEVLVVVICCSAAGKPPQAIRTDRQDVRFDDWDAHLPYCHITLDKQQNIGLESSAYLHYFATRHANLSKWTIMVHGNHGWHDHVHKRCSQWLPLSLPYVPLPSPLVHDPDIDLRYDRKVSIQEFYDTQFVARFGYDPVELTAPGTDRLHFCCAQFIVSRDAVHRNNASVYAMLRDYVYDENNDYRTSRELEHSWPILLTGAMHTNDATMTAVEQWREDAMMTPCRPWGCTCQGLSDLHNVWIAHAGTAPPFAYAWFMSGDYEHVGIIQVTTLGQTLGKGMMHSSADRSVRTGRCLSVPAGMDPHIVKDDAVGFKMREKSRPFFSSKTMFGMRKNKLL